MLLSFVMPAFSPPAFTGTWKLKTKKREQKTEAIHSRSRYLSNIFEIVWTELYQNILFTIYVFHWAEYEVEKIVKLYFRQSEKVKNKV